MTATADTTTLAGKDSSHALIWVKLEQLFRRPWFYYGTLLLLQLKRIWGMWQYRELTTGDTSAYFVDAWKWFHLGRTDIAWSPLYECFYGSLLHLSHDVATVTVLHRVLIVLAATLLVLAVARRMLPAELAWLVGVWWAVLPINFDTMYEVHLFALLPVLVAWLVIMSGRGPWARGIALAIFFISAVLVRNEMSVATLCLAVVCLGWEIGQRQRRRTGAAAHGGFASFLAYVVPGLVAAGVVLAVYARTDPKFPELKAALESKHTVNMAQVYAAGYEQRHPEDGKNPWTDFQALCIRDFGTALPSFELMVRRNPRAFIEHVLWNYRLLPNGLQMMLFSASSGSLDPDYAGVNLNEQYPLVLSVIAVAVAVIGTFLLVKERRHSWHPQLPGTPLGWLAMLCALPVAAVVIATQRPRPSYLFSLTFVLMTYVATCLYVIGRRIPGIERLRPLMPLLMVALAVAVPSSYGGKVHPRQPMLEAYEQLRPYERLIANPKAVFVAGEYRDELDNYLGGGQQARILDYGIFDLMSPGASVGEILNSHHATLFYLDHAGWMSLDARSPGIVDRFVRDGRDQGWELVAYGVGQRDSRWMLCRRVATEPSRGSAGIINPLPGSDKFSGWSETESLAAMEGPYPAQNLPIVRWGLAPATTLTVRTERAGRFVILVGGAPALSGQEVNVSVDGRPVARLPFAPSGFSRFSLPVSLSAGPHMIVLRYAKWVEAAPTIWEAVLFDQLTLRDDPGIELPSQPPVQRDTSSP